MSSFSLEISVGQSVVRFLIIHDDGGDDYVYFYYGCDLYYHGLTTVTMTATSTMIIVLEPSTCTP